MGRLTHVLLVPNDKIFEPQDNFYLKNNSTIDGVPTPIRVQIRPAKLSNYIETTLAPGWNPEYCSGVRPVAQTESNIQISILYGW